jgi:hypothetical protein
LPALLEIPAISDSPDRQDKPEQPDRRVSRALSELSVYRELLEFLDLRAQPALPA